MNDINVICYGDSNTYGFDPRSFLGSRYEAPWPELLAGKTGWNIINQGENGRTIPKYAVIFPEETDALFIMLGTNDLLQSTTPKEAAQNMGRFLQQINVSRNKLLVIAPPPLTYGEWVQNKCLIDNSKALAVAYQTICADLGIRFFDAGICKIPLAFDGVHFTQEGHKQLTDGLYQYLKIENT